MKISSFLTVLIIILLIAAGSLWYTATDNDRMRNTEATMQAENTPIEDVEYQSEIIDTVPQDIDSTLRFIEFNNSFEHTKPGEYSEVIVQATGFQPGEYMVMYLRKAGTQEYIDGGRTLNADENGIINTRFTITEFGDYEVEYAGNVSPVITVN